MARPRLPLDAAVVPALLLLIARDLVLHDPLRVLTWRVLHDPALQPLPAWLAALLPRSLPEFDRDAVALLLAGAAGVSALVYLGLSVLGARPRWRAAVIVAASLILVVAPSLAFIGIGHKTGRPLGQDGGVVQLPLALDKLLAAKSPYGADYADSILGKQARASSFWEPFGGNPILRHHAYLPGTHALVLPFHLAARAAGVVSDPRVATLLAYGLVALLAARLVLGAAAKLAAAACVLLNPLVYWQQIFGANDLLFVAALLVAWLAARDGHELRAGIALGFACATKQLAWPFAPFLLLHLSGARCVAELAQAQAWRRMRRPALAALVTFVVVVAPVAVLDVRAFWGDVVAYNVGLPGADVYPLGGTPGVGFANLLIYFGRVASLRDPVAFGRFYLLLLPLGLWLGRRQLAEPSLGRALLNGNVALVASLYFSRVVHPNYFVAAAVLLPLAALVGRRGADTAVLPLLLLAGAIEVATATPFKLTWDQAVTSGLAPQLTGFSGYLRPRAGPSLTLEPIDLLVSGVLAGLAMMYLATAALELRPALRAALATLAAVLGVALPTLAMIGISQRTGVRAADPWVVQVQADADRLRGGQSPYTLPLAEQPIGRQAWSASFRLEPPAELVPQRPSLPPSAAPVVALLRSLGWQDPRWLTLLLAGATIVLLLVVVPVGGRALAVGTLALAPPAIFGIVFGSPAPVAACAIAMVMAVAASAGPRRAAWGTGAVLALLAAPILLLDPFATLRALARDPDLVPGIGFWNLAFYLGLENTAGVRGAAALAPVVVAAGAFALYAERQRRNPVALAALAALLGVVLLPGLSVESGAIPMLLAAWACSGGFSECA